MTLMMTSFACVSMLMMVCGLALLHQCVDGGTVGRIPQVVCKSSSDDALEDWQESSDKYDKSLLKEAMAELDKEENRELKTKYERLVAKNKEAGTKISKAVVKSKRCPVATKWMTMKGCVIFPPVSYVTCKTKACQNTCTNMACDYWYRCRHDHYVAKWAFRWCPSNGGFGVIGWCVPTQCNCYRTNCNGVIGLFNGICC